MHSHLYHPGGLHGSRWGCRNSPPSKPISVPARRTFSQQSVHLHVDEHARKLTRQPSGVKNTHKAPSVLRGETSERRAFGVRETPILYEERYDVFKMYPGSLTNWTSVTSVEILSGWSLTCLSRPMRRKSICAAPALYTTDRRAHRQRKTLHMCRMSILCAFFSIGTAITTRI